MIAHVFFEAYGWDPETLCGRTMRELVAYSKLIKRSAEEDAKFQAALLDKKLEIPNESAIQVDPGVKDKIKELMDAAAKRRGFT